MIAIKQKQKQIHKCRSRSSVHAAFGLSVLNMLPSCLSPLLHCRFTLLPLCVLFYLCFALRTTTQYSRLIFMSFLLTALEICATFQSTERWKTMAIKSVQFFYYTRNYQHILMITTTTMTNIQKRKISWKFIFGSQKKWKYDLWQSSIWLARKKTERYALINDFYFVAVVEREIVILCVIHI